MKNKEFDAVELKRKLQREAAGKLSPLTEKEQLELLHKRYGHLMRKRAKVRFG